MHVSEGCWEYDGFLVLKSLAFTQGSHVGSSSKHAYGHKPRAFTVSAIGRTRESQRGFLGFPKAQGPSSCVSVQGRQTFCQNSNRLPTLGDRSRKCLYNIFQTRLVTVFLFGVGQELLDALRCVTTEEEFMLCSQLAHCYDCRL